MLVDPLHLIMYLEGLTQPQDGLLTGTWLVKVFNPKSW